MPTSMNASRAERLVSVVVPLFNEGECLPAFYASLARVCRDLPYRFEFLFVDDGSADATAARLAEIQAADARVRVLRFSRNFGQQAALRAGLERARGDAVVMMDGDLQHPPELLPDLLVRFEAGFDVVQTVRRATAGGGFMRGLLSDGFYRVFRGLTGVEIKPGMADFRLISRRVVEALREYPERRRFLRGLIRQLGFRQTELEFVAPARHAGRSKFTVTSNLRFAADGLIAFAPFPTGLFGAGGLAAIALGSAGFAWSAWTGAGGATAVLAATAFISGVVAVTGALLGAYLSRILDEVRRRPLYHVEGTLPSDPSPWPHVEPPHVEPRESVQNACTLELDPHWSARL